SLLIGSSIHTSALPILLTAGH
ncbi:MAG: hypothetical protein H6Q87_1315, partial [candidate division NC10 bacterium]|nr:hypothetical protein [candidate division NC10 bacterium]